jgi:hypothetical protein
MYIMIECHICGEKIKSEDGDAPNFCLTCAADLADPEEEKVIKKKAGAFEASGEYGRGNIYLTNKRLLCIELPEPHTGVMVAGGILGGLAGIFLGNFWGVRYINSAVVGPLVTLISYYIAGLVSKKKQKKVYFILPLTEIESLEESSLVSRLSLKMKAFTITTKGGEAVTIAARPGHEWIEAVAEAKEDLIMYGGNML